jgi:hypothetical protein
VEVIIRNSSLAKVKEIVFNNSSVVLPTDPKLMADPPIMKTVSGNPKKGNVFTFVLTALNPANPMPAGSANGVKMVHITGTGIGEFGR